MRNRLFFAGGFLLGLTLRLWRATLRLESRHHDLPDTPFVLVFWHGRLCGPVMDNIGRGAVSISSRSSDGAVAAGALRALGLGAARGSSSRGGREALREIELMIRNGAPFAGLTVDGPRGPWRRVKAGAIVLARRLRIPIVPATFSTPNPWLLRSWDRMVLPRPFSRVVVAYGQQWPVVQLEGEADAVVAAITTELDEMDRALDLEVAGRALWSGD